MTTMNPLDDFIHAPTPGVDRWTENVQWNLFGPNGVGVLWHMGTMLGASDLWHVVVMVVLPDGRVLATKQVGPGHGHFGTSDAQMITVDAFERWSFSFLGGMREVTTAARSQGLVADGPHCRVEVRLDLRAAYPVWVPAGSDEHGDWGKFHHEQAVRGEGSVTVGDTEYALDAVGHRDHSIGPRDMSLLRRAFWGNGIFESGWAFATMQGDYVEGDFQRAAIFDHQGTTEVTMTSWSKLGSADGQPYDIELELATPSGPLMITGRVRTGMNYTVIGGAEFCMGTDVGSPDDYMLTNLFVEWRCAGEAGLGYLDRGARIGLLTAPPAR